jgi:hypothetical protein
MKPIIVINPKLLAFLTLGFASGLTLWPFIILQKHDDRIIRHESIHIKQQEEMLVIFFYFWYVMEWLIRKIKFKTSISSYKHLSFEQEAYANQNDLQYLNNRKKYSWIKYI